MPKFTDEQLDAEVLYRLKQHRGRTNPIGRWEFVAKIYGPEAAFPQSDDNIADREIRFSVNRLRKRGVLICDMGDGKGRFLADTMEEFQTFKVKFGARAYDVIDTLNEMDKAARQEFPDALQPKLL